MIRKLRLKIVGISVIAVAVLLVSVLAAVALSTRSQMVRASESRLQEALAGHMLSGAQPGSGGGQPCFVADIYADGTVRLAGSGYYDLDNDALILSIVQDALQQESREGILPDYALRYMRQTGTLTVRLAFTDCSQEQATMRSLLLRMGGVSLAALLLLTGVSYWLAGFAVKPVQQAWQEQKQFVSDASHELKTPLTVILSSAELAASETDGEKSRQYLDNIHAESLRMKDLVEDMLTLARTESGTRLPEEAVDLSDTVLESALAFEPVAFENGKPMEYTVQPELTVSGRSTQLRQVADILLDNAVKYAEPGSPIQMTLRREGRNAVLWVENRSAPIPPEKLGHLFDRFYRVDESRTGGEGFGLGLAIARTIVQSHRGSIGCTSSQGVTRFTVTLPLAKNEVTKRGSET